MTVHATDTATQDLGDGTVQGFLDAGGQAVPGSDRGVARATSTNDTAISQDQAVRLGSDIASSLG